MTKCFKKDPGTDYEWKLFGIISCGGLALCLFFGIIFLLLYAKYKHERSKEEFENEMKENKDPHGNDIKKAGLTNVYKYSKPADETVGYLNENENIQTPQPTLQPHQFIMPPVQPLPQFQQIEPPPPPQQPVRTVIMKSKPKKIIIRRSRSGVVEDDEDGPERVVIRRELSDSNISRRMVKVHREPSQKQIVQVVEREQSPQQIVQMVKREPSRQVVHVVQEENPEVVYVQQKKKEPFSLKVMAKNLIKKVRGTPQEVQIVNRPSNYVVEKQEPSMREIEIRSPSHIQAIAIEPHREIIKTPKIIKISRNEMVSSRTPVSSTSRTQLIETSSDKRPVILNKNFGENLNAFN